MTAKISSNEQITLNLRHSLQELVRSRRGFMMPYAESLTNIAESAATLSKRTTWIVTSEGGTPIKIRPTLMTWRRWSRLGRLVPEVRTHRRRWRKSRSADPPRSTSAMQCYACSDGLRMSIFRHCRRIWRAISPTSQSHLDVHGSSESCCHSRGCHGWQRWCSNVTCKEGPSSMDARIER